MKNKRPSFKISAHLMKTVRCVKLNHKAYGIVRQLCSFPGLIQSIDKASIPAVDHKHYIYIEQKYISEMRQLLKHALKYAEKKKQKKALYSFLSITEKSIKSSMNSLL